MRLQLRQRLRGESSHPLVLAGLGVALEQLDRLDVRLVLRLNVGFVEVAALAPREFVDDRLVLCIELVRRHGELGVQHCFLKLYRGGRVVRCAKALTGAAAVRSSASLLLSTSNILPKAAWATKDAVGPTCA